MAKSRNFKPGERAPKSGLYEMVGPRGGKTGEERTVTRGQPLPPTRDSGQKYKLAKTLQEGRGKANTQNAISKTHDRFSKALNKLAKR
jgi:hypothetical protein